MIPHSVAGSSTNRRRSRQEEERVVRSVLREAAAAAASIFRSTRAVQEVNFNSIRILRE